MLDRAMFHLDNCYYVPHVRRHRPRLPHAPRLAHRLPRLRRPAGHARDRGDPRSHRAARSACRRTSCASATSTATGDNTTHYGQVVGDRAHRAHLVASCRRRSVVRGALGRDRRVQRGAAAHVKRGLAITPVKFGISFTTTFFNQAGALVLVYRDGTVQVNHGGTEMGQGLHTKMPADRRRRELGVPRRRDPRDADAHRQGAEHVGDGGVERLRSERRGGAATPATTLRERLAARSPPSASAVRGGRRSCSPTAASIRAAQPERGVAVRGGRRARPTWRTCRSPRPASTARRASTSTAQTGTGKPFHYFAYGAAVSEVEVDGFTGQNRAAARRHPARRRRLAVAAVDRGQIEGGFVQGVGWLTSEELVWDADGALAHARRVDLQAPDARRVPARFPRRAPRARRASPASSTAARRSASRR